MARVQYYTADSRKVGEEVFDRLADAQKAARDFVSRNGLNTYRTKREGDRTRYYHSYGEREAIVREP